MSQQTDQAPPRPPAERQPPSDGRPAPQDTPLASIATEDTRAEVGPVTPETSVADVLLGSIGLVGALIVGSVILGVALGAVLVFFKHRLGWGGPDKDTEDHVSLTER